MFILFIFDLFFPSRTRASDPEEFRRSREFQLRQQPQEQTSNTNAYFRVVEALRPTVNFIFGSRPSHRQGLPLR